MRREPMAYRPRRRSLLVRVAVDFIAALITVIALWAGLVGFLLVASAATGTL